MRILIDSGNYFANNDNQGDRAIYQIITRRLRHLWPDCEIEWITRNNLLGNISTNISPLLLSDERLSFEHKECEEIAVKPTAKHILKRFSWMMSKGTKQFPTLTRAQISDSERILSAIKKSDLVMATGGGYFNDCFPSHAWAVLDTLETAIQYNKPSFILSAGFEPIRNPDLLNKILSILPKLNLIVCREPYQSVFVAHSFGAKKEQIAVAGDDAVELAFEARPAVLGNSLGINLRKADYSGIDSTTIKCLQSSLQLVVKKLDIPIVPLPISMSGPSDPEAICELLSGLNIISDGGQSLSSPIDVINQVAKCRLVVTGSYHAAVFALSQGISVVALAASPHYKAKLEGLKVLFGTGCYVEMLNANSLNETLSKTIELMWQQADGARPLLLQAAKKQIVASQIAYTKIYNIAELLLKAKNSTETLRSLEKSYPSSNMFHDDLSNVDESSLIERAGNFKGPSVSSSISPEIKQLTLSSKEIESFRKNGFIGPFTAYEPSEMAAFKQVIYDRVLPTPTPHCPFGLRVRHLDSRTIYDLCTSPEIIGRLVSLFGQDLILWNSNIFNKPPAELGHMEEYPWHQDYYNWQMEPVINISAWLAITPATLENGCVEVIPGSHKSIIPPVRDTDSQYSMRFGGVASDPSYIDESSKVSLTLQPGQFFLFNERILHHSNPNMSKEARLGLAMRFTVPIVEVSESFPCILVSGTDHMGFNKYIDKPTDEPDMDWLTSLPYGHDFIFDRPIPGMGWHLREKENNQNFAWTGMEPKAWIDFRAVNNRDYILCFEVIYQLSINAADDASASVNNQYVSLKKKNVDGIVILEALVPKHIFSSRKDRVRVALEVKNLIRPCDINSESLDKRTLGLAVRRISLTPVI